MNSELLHNLLTEAVYSIKLGTTAVLIDNRFKDIESIESRKEKADAIKARTKALVAQGQEVLLPIKLGYITNEETARIAGSGRGARARCGQIKATYTNAEQSPYKIAKPFKLCTSVWQIEGYKCFYYGTIGITQQEGMPPKDNGDLVIFYTADWKEVCVFIFKGLASPNGVADLEGIVQFLKEERCL